MPRGAEDRRRGGVTVGAAVRADYLGCLCEAFSTRRRGESFSACLPANPSFLPISQNYLIFSWKYVEIYENTLTSGNYHSSLSGKCAKQLTGVCAPSFNYYQIEKKTTAETITAHSSPSKYSSPLLPKIIQLLPVQLLPVQLLPALARAEI